MTWTRRSQALQGVRTLIAGNATAPQIAGMIASTLPLAFLATSMQTLLGIFAKSFKDAQSYIGILVMLPIAPAMFTMFNPVVTKTWVVLHHLRHPFPSSWKPCRRSGKFSASRNSAHCTVDSTSHPASRLPFRHTRLKKQLLDTAEL